MGCRLDDWPSLRRGGEKSGEVTYGCYREEFEGPSCE